MRPSVPPPKLYQETPRNHARVNGWDREPHLMLSARLQGRDTKWGCSRGWKAPIATSPLWLPEGRSRSTAFLRGSAESGLESNGPGWPKTPQPFSHPVREVVASQERLTRFLDDRGTVSMAGVRGPPPRSSRPSLLKTSGDDDDDDDEEEKCEMVHSTAGNTSDRRKGHPRGGLPLESVIISIMNS
jgi:hypothetical protein